MIGKAVVEFPSATGAARDTIQHTYWCSFNLIDVLIPGNAAGQLNYFADSIISDIYNDTYTPTGGGTPVSVAGFMAHWIARGSCVVKKYLVDETNEYVITTGERPGDIEVTRRAEGGGPATPDTFIGQETFTLGAIPEGTAALDLPAEVACCLSIRNENATEVFVRRRRGRIYQGPFNATASEAYIADGPADYSRPNAALREALVQGAVALWSDMANGDLLVPRAVWCIYSRTSRLTTSVELASVDDEWDTQRRRGARPKKAMYWFMAGGDSSITTIDL